MQLASPPNFTGILKPQPAGEYRRRPRRRNSVCRCSLLPSVDPRAGASRVLNATDATRGGRRERRELLPSCLHRGASTRTREASPRVSFQKRESYNNYRGKRRAEKWRYSDFGDDLMALISSAVNFTKETRRRNFLALRISCAVVIRINKIFGLERDEINF